MGTLEEARFKDNYFSVIFFFNDTATTEIYTLSLHDALPISIKYFRDEYLSHIHDKTCPAKVCVDLIDVVINQDLCRQCAVCIKHCPVQAISGARHEYTVIDPDACIGCRMCISVCPWNTIDVDSPKQLIVPAEKYRRPVNKENVAESVRCKADESRGGGA